MSSILGRIAKLVAPLAIALALMTNTTTAHAASPASSTDSHSVTTKQVAKKKDRYTVTVGVTGWTWSNGAYVGVKFSRTKTEYLYSGVIGEGVFAAVSAVCGSIARAPYGVVMAPTCVGYMTARYTQMKNALADAHNDGKCVEFRHWPAGFNPFAKAVLAVDCTYNE